jgi:hypothetical protein
VSGSPLRLPIALLSAVALAGCASSHGLYKWGGYDELLYQSYKEPGRAGRFQGGLEAHIAALERAHATVAPGLYAELGTLYMQNGDGAKAVQYYTKERDAWPESRTLMDSLIRHAGDSKASSAATS